MGWLQSSGGVHIAVAMAKVLSWMGLMQTNGGVHMGTDTVAVAATQCEQDFTSSYWTFVVKPDLTHLVKNLGQTID